MKYYTVHVTQTGKALGSKAPAGEGYSIFNEEEKRFFSLDACKSFLREAYGKNKRVKMYRDMPDGSAKHTGYIYSFRNEDLSHARSDDNKPWYQQDWVEVREVEATTIII